MRSQYFQKGWELSHVRYNKYLWARAAIVRMGADSNSLETRLSHYQLKKGAPVWSILWSRYCLLRAAGPNWWGRKSSSNKPPVYATLGSLFLNHTPKLKRPTFFYLSSIKQMTKSRRTQSVHQLWQGFVTWYREIGAEERAAKWWMVLMFTKEYKETDLLLVEKRLSSMKFPDN
jgi:hypothetical protein